ncbi:FAD:protein FMN transferase [Polynucleobacter sp. IMCC30063]|uniref:FAD:protein FMN transferase n=1 Tax=unclassified Polynucleobacter TaxID=2640945 RepID=UPI001F262747|nr:MULTISPECIES: FAD:protein FMN transferase [unclassified Polynucleobacter]MCE7506331.1 FAD:protein FMN transferase [Polynucleobacter sp. IMCC30063]MCE7527611.1 FAD:protein FMN transferase [Polynucleobacter sp. IMCC 30228]
MNQTDWRSLKRCKPLLGTYVDISAHTYTGHSIAYRDLKYCIEKAFTTISEIQSRLNFYADDSELSHFNRLVHLRPLSISTELKTILLIAQQIFVHSAGLFNCGIGQRTIKLKKARAAFGDLADLEFLPNGLVYAKRPLCLNLGGIAKGYAVDCAVENLLQQGVAAGCVNAGGDLRVFGASGQKIYIRLPHQWQSLIELGELQNGAVASSANYFYRHDQAQTERQGIVHPTAGLRSDSPHSYSVIAPQCVHADALTKVLILSNDVRHPCFERFSAKPVIFYHE